LFSGKPIRVEGSSFVKHVQKTSVPVIVDFWAPWCVPCKMMAPVFEEAATRLEPHCRLLKLNTEEDGDTAARYRIQSIPTIAMFKGGREAVRKSGAVDLQNLIRWVQSNL
jgi:thioredoxin 2